MSATGKRIGTIKRLVIERASGQVAYAVTAFGGFLGIGSEVHTIPWEHLNHDRTLCGHLTTITEQQLREAPEFSRGDGIPLSQRDWDELGEHCAGPA